MPQADPGPGPHGPLSALFVPGCGGRATRLTLLDRKFKPSPQSLSIEVVAAMTHGPLGSTGAGVTWPALARERPRLSRLAQRRCRITRDGVAFRRGPGRGARYARARAESRD